MESKDVERQTGEERREKRLTVGALYQLTMGYRAANYDRAELQL